MRARLVVMAVVLAAALAAPFAPAATASTADPLTIKGGRIVDAQGRQVILHGANTVFKLAPYYPPLTRSDFRRMRSWGFNAIRLGVIWAGLEPQPGVIDQDYIAHVQAIVKLAAKEGFWVLLDMHQDLYAQRFTGEGAPEWAVLDDGIPFTPTPGDFALNYATPAVGRAFTSFWTDRNGIRTEYVRAFAALAQRFASSQAVIGYDLFNEPSCEFQLGPPCGLPPDPPVATQFLMPLYDQLVPALRAADPRHPSFYEDSPTVNFGFPFLIGASGGPAWPYPNQGLSHHVYCSPDLRAGVSCPQQERQAVGNAIASAQHNDVAPLQTEFGATDDLATLRRVTADEDAAGEGWLYWQYKTYDDPTTSSSAGPGGTDAESIVAVSGRVKQAKVHVLARAYPERIAGTDARWSFDARSGVFSLRYTPRGSGPTVVVVPEPAYPRGACTTGRGFTQRSDPESNRLRLSAQRGATHVAFRAFPCPNT
jgi:endoglycosylceramidase